MANTPRTVVVKVHDRLEHMYNLQRELQTLVPPSPVDPFLRSDEEKMEYLRTQTLALITELAEALGETGWKPWASSNHINADAFRGEIVDAWHFLMNLMFVVDMTPSELYEGYLRKQAINRKRQQDGYDGVTTKCPACKRAYDDPSVTCAPCCSTEEGPQFNCTGKPLPAWCGVYGYVNDQGKTIRRVGTTWEEYTP